MKLVALQVEWKGKLNTGKSHAVNLYFFLVVLGVRNEIKTIFCEPAGDKAFLELSFGKISHLNVRWVLKMFCESQALILFPLWVWKNQKGR